MAKWCDLWVKVTIDSVWEVLYEKSIGTKMNELDLCLEVVLRSCQLMRHIRRWISRKPSELEAWFQRTTNRKWPTGNQMVTDDDVTRSRKVKLVSLIGLERNFSKTAGDAIWQQSLITSLLWCSTVGGPSDSLASCSDSYKTLSFCTLRGWKYCHN